MEISTQIFTLRVLILMLSLSLPPVSGQLSALHLLQEFLVLLPAGDRVGRGHHVGEGRLAAGQARHQQAQQDRHDPRTGVGHPHQLGLSAHIT